MAPRASVLRVSMLNVLFHNDSRSATELFLGSDCLTVHTRVQSLSIVEDMPGLDQDGNGWLDDSECRVGQAAIVDRLFAGMEFGSLRVGKPAQAAVVLEERVRDGFGIDLYQWVSVQWVSRLEVIPEELEYRLEWFAGTSPGHRDQVRASWPGRVPQTAVTYVGRPAIRLQPGESLFAQSVRTGMQAAWMDGLGLALCLALVAVYGARWRNLVAAMGWTTLGAVGVSWWCRGSALQAGFWRGALLVALAYGLLDARWQTKLRPAWPSVLWGFGWAAVGWSGPPFSTHTSWVAGLVSVGAVWIGTLGAALCLRPWPARVRWALAIVAWVLCALAALAGIYKP